MKINPEQTQILDAAVTAHKRAAEAAERAEITRLEAIDALQEAKDAGVPMRQLAQATGLGYMTILRRLERTEH